MENIEVSINHTVGELNTILKALGQLTYNESATLIAKIKSIGESALNAEAARIAQTTTVPVAPAVAPAVASAAKPAKPAKA